MSFRLILPNSILKNLSTIPDVDKNRIITKLTDIEENPYLVGCLKLKGFDDQYRIRVGDYRIRFFIDKKIKVVIILDIAHRKDVYKS
jgi:mRNA interferase RelE/StbE